MSATIALVRIQLHFLKWPLVVLLASFALIYCFPLGPESPSVFGFISVISAILLIWIAGPLLYGAEYVEGSRDYINTRPVSANQVFWTKMVFLLPFVVCAALILPGGITVVVVCLDMALACVAMTILFQDTVRGLLLGPVAFAGVNGVLLGFWYLLCGNHTDLSTMEENLGTESMYWFNALNTHFLLGAALLTPLIFLWATAWAYHFRRTGRWIPPKDPSIVLVIPSILYFCFTASLWYTEGVASFIPFKSSTPSYAAPFRSCLSRVLVDNQQRYLSLSEKEGEFVLHKMDANTTAPEPVEVCRFNKEMLFDNKTNITYFPHVGPRWNTWIDDKHILIWENNSTQIATIDYDQSGIQNIRKIVLDYSPTSLMPFHNDIIRLQAPILIKNSSGDIECIKYNRHELSLESGEINEISDVISVNLFSVIVTSSRLYKFWVATGQFPTLEWGEPSNQATVPDSSKLLRVQDFAVSNDTLVAAHCMARVSSITESVTFIPVVDTITLCDTSDLSNPRFESVILPFRVSGAYTKIYEAYKLLGYADFRSPYSYPGCTDDQLAHVTLGGGYLFYGMPTLGRVAVWNVHDLDDIRFLGLCKIPFGDYCIDHSSLLGNRFMNATTPQLRSDGALGIIVDNYGPVWLEFPTLMKEAKS